jgi:hypothetical protein
MTAKSATLIRTLTTMRGDARLYRVDPPMPTEDGHADYVIVSAVVVPFSGPETYIFPAASADSTSPTDWGELDGSFQGALNHEAALTNAGYVVHNLSEQR